MFSKVFVEKTVQNEKYVQHILHRLKVEPILIDDYTSIWGKVKKPYLQKRTNLNLFLAEKKGDLIKETPPAYGFDHHPHYYFIHSYNCIYECSYCYLQGYFHTPDIVLFTNHDEIIGKMQEVANQQEKIWFHAGEFSDSLALNSISNEWPYYWQFFKDNPNAFLELRTKSSNIKEILKLEPLPNTIISFSLSPEDVAKDYDLKCPNTSIRLKAIEKLVKAGFQIGIHLDPIIYDESLKDQYHELIKELRAVLPDNQLEYMSLGVVRFTKDVYYSVQKNYPDSKAHAQEFIKSFDGKIRYSRPMRNWILNIVKDLAAKVYSKDKIYLCMED